MNKNPNFLAGRAVASVVIRRYAGSFTILFVSISFVGLVVTLLLATIFSEWWALLMVLFVPLLSISGLLYVVVRFISSRIAPRKLSKSERKQTQEFVNDVQYTYITARAIKSSPTGIGLAAALAYLTGGRNKAVRSVMSPIESSKGLKEKFADLVELFSQ